MRTVIDGVLAGALPWGLVGTGAMFSLCAMLAGLPGLSFAIGIYLPLGTLTPIFLGGILRRMVEARRVGPPPESDPGVLASSGMIAGEGLAGVTIAFIIGAQKYWPEAGWSMALAAIHFGDRKYAHLGGLAGAVLGMAIVAGLSVLLFRAGRSALPAPPPDPTPIIER
jgi:hypothetical protein